MYQQINIIKIMETLGYPIKGKGLCFGITSMARQAILAGELKTFDARIEKIGELCDAFKYLYTTLPERVNALEQEEQLDLIAFFDGVMLYHKLELPSEVLSNQFDQTGREAAQFVTPIELEDNLPTIVKSDCFVFNRREYSLRNWLDSLKNHLNAGAFVIEMSSMNHHILISYDQNRWIWIDPNFLPSTRLYDSRELEREINSVFDPSWKMTGNIIFDATLSTKESDRQAILDQLAGTNWERMQQESIEYARNTDQFGSNLLHFATMFSKVSLAKDLIHSGDLDLIDQKTKDGFSALFIAAQRGNFEILSALIEHGADPNIQTNQGCTALHIAAQNGHLEIVEYLIEHGASVDLAMNDGRTPQQIAENNAHPEIADLIEQKAAVPRAGTNFGF